MPRLGTKDSNKKLLSENYVARKLSLPMVLVQ